MAIDLQFTLAEDGRATAHGDPTALRVKLNVVPDGNVESGNLELLAKNGLGEALRGLAIGTVLTLSFTTLGPKGIERAFPKKDGV